MLHEHHAPLRSMLSILGACFVAFLATPLFAEEGAGEPPAARAEAPVVWVVDFEGPIAGIHQAYVRRHLERAAEAKPDFLVIRFDSPGGTVHHSMLISEQLFALPDEIHTVAWVPKEAISGACLAAMACDEIIMGHAGTIGDCQPIVMDPSSGGVTPVGEKLESPLRALFRKYAEGAGHPVALSEAFVSQHLVVIEVIDTRDDSRRFIDGKWFENAEPDALLSGDEDTLRKHLKVVGAPVVEEGELLTITGPEAQRLGFMTRKFENGLPRDEATVIEALAGPNAQVTVLDKTFSERAAKWLQAFGGLMAAVVALSVLVFMYQGPGVMTIVGIAALVLALLVAAVAEQLHAVPLFLIFVGIIMLAIEVFVIPGFALFGILGIGGIGLGFLLLLSGSTLSADGPTLTKDMAVSFGLQFVAGCLAGVAALIFLTRFFPSLGPGKKLMLATTTVPSGSAVTLSEGAALAVGDIGTARTVLRPAGGAVFGQAHVDVTSNGGFIDPDTPIRIVAIEGTRIIVEPKEPRA